MRKALALILSLCLAAGGILLLVEAQKPADAAGVTVTVTAKTKITLTMADQSVAFGEVDPGVAITAGSTPISATVMANRTWTLAYTAGWTAPSGGADLSSLKWGTSSTGSDATSFGASGNFLTDQPKTSGTGITQYYTIDLPGDATAGDYGATITYSAVSGS